MHTYIPDLSPYPVTKLDESHEYNVIAIGWLNPDYDYSVGDVPVDFVVKMEWFCTKPLIRTFGAEFCLICGVEEVVNIRLHSGKDFTLYGANELRILSLDKNKVYAAPDLVLHYIVNHHYKPPQEFIDAVLAAPLPGTPEYEAFTSPWKKYH